MTPRQFADLAAVISRHAEELTTSDGPPPASLHRVWKRSSRCFRLWRERLAACATPRLYADLFAAELPLRAWCTAVAATGRTRIEAPGAAIAAKIYGDLLELRCMALQALAADHGLTTTEAAAVDRFRRRCERWVDVLVGPIAARTGVTDFAVRPDRAIDFADGDDPSGESSWPLVTAGLQLAFAPAEEFRGPERPIEGSEATDLASALVATLPESAFDAVGLLRSPAHARIARVVDERRPAKRRRPVGKPASIPNESVLAEKPPVESVQVSPQISFASLRKRRPIE